MTSRTMKHRLILLVTAQFLMSSCNTVGPCTTLNRTDFGPAAEQIGKFRVTRRQGQLDEVMGYFNYRYQVECQPGQYRPATEVGVPMLEVSRPDLTTEIKVQEAPRRFYALNSPPTPPRPIWMYFFDHLAADVTTYRIRERFPQANDHPGSIEMTLDKAKPPISGIPELKVDSTTATQPRLSWTPTTGHEIYFLRLSQVGTSDPDQLEGVEIAVPGTTTAFQLGALINGTLDPASHLAQYERELRYPTAPRGLWNSSGTGLRTDRTLVVTVAAGFPPQPNSNEVDWRMESNPVLLTPHD